MSYRDWKLPSNHIGPTLHHFKPQLVAKLLGSAPLPAVMMLR